MKARVLVLALCMLITGSINTIATKFQDVTVTGYAPDGRPLTFKHPGVQSACMFFGELLCLIPYLVLRARKRAARKARGYVSTSTPEEKSARYWGRFFAFAIPALCDACATTLLNVGLYYTFASTYQMLRGTLVLFAGLFTILILRRQLFIHHWLGMVLITAGAALVGASSIIGTSSAPAGAKHPPHHLDGGPGSRALQGATDLLRMLADPPAPDAASAPLFGDVLVVAAQGFAALQFILEEKFLAKYRVPALLAVGLEGFWGVIICCVGLPLLATFKDASGVPFDDALGAVREIKESQQLQVAVFGSIISIAFFNFFGISVTKSLSGAARATIDACRTLFIWLVSLHIGWEVFVPLQVLGFAVTVSGTSLYNEILRACLPAPATATAERGGGSDEESVEAGPRAGSAAVDEVRQPLLGARSATGAAGPAGKRSHSVPVARPPLPRHMRQQASGGESGGGGGDVYTMARSMRLGPGYQALSPHALGDDEDADVAGSYSDAGQDVPSMSYESPGGLPVSSPGPGPGLLHAAQASRLRNSDGNQPGAS